jgi:hypothetical protein
MAAWWRAKTMSQTPDQEQPLARATERDITKGSTTAEELQGTRSRLVEYVLLVVDYLSAKFARTPSQNNQSQMARDAVSMGTHAVVGKAAEMALAPEARLSEIAERTAAARKLNAEAEKLEEEAAVLRLQRAMIMMREFGATVTVRFSTNDQPVIQIGHSTGFEVQRKLETAGEPVDDQIEGGNDD